jgi:hypothetical protein
MPKQILACGDEEASPTEPGDANQQADDQNRERHVPEL